MDIVFMGSGAFGLPALDALAASAHRILHVISQPDRPAGRGKRVMPTPVAQWALGRGVPLTRTEDSNQPPMVEMLASLKPDILVVIAFGQKLSAALLAAAPRGGINLHSSLLPRYRGAAPINWAIIEGESLAGVSVITVTPVMDGGDILASASTPIGPSETAGELHDRLALLGAPLVPGVLDDLAQGRHRPIRQDTAQTSRAPKLSRELAWVDFTQPAQRVSARIRGMSPWPGVQVELLEPPASPGVRVTATILKCQVSPSTAFHGADRCGQVLPDLTVACGSGSLQLLTLQPVGKNAMPLKAFANGYGYAPGVFLRSRVRPVG